MPAKDELGRRRYERLVDLLESMMRATLKPQYEGYYGQLILSGDDLAEMGDLKTCVVLPERPAAVSAGNR
ncbi:hypothetical protein ACIBKX_36645 [Streptomyces sp. NPDC050658]|uniref:hypothetical protein n=1 Tax=unclassified Streptomyces TaxID=2593676 RepID=UPI003439750A